VGSRAESSPTSRLRGEQSRKVPAHIAARTGPLSAVIKQQKPHRAIRRGISFRIGLTRKGQGPAALEAGIEAAHLSSMSIRTNWPIGKLPNQSISEKLSTSAAINPKPCKKRASGGVGPLLNPDQRLHQSWNRPWSGPRKRNRKPGCGVGVARACPGGLSSFSIRCPACHAQNNLIGEPSKPRLRDLVVPQ